MNKSLTFLFAFIFAFGFSQVDKFPVAARLNTTSVNEYSKIKLSPEFYSFSKNSLSDLRIYHINENDTIEQAYLIGENFYPKSQTLSFAKILNLAKNGQQLSFDLDFGSLKSFNSLSFELEKQSEFDCRVIVLIENNTGLDTVIDNERISALYYRNKFYSFLNIQFPELIQQKIKVILKSRNNQNLPSISNVSIDENFSPNKSGEACNGKMQITNQEKEKITTLIWESEKSNFISGFSIRCNQNQDFLRNVEFYYENVLGGKSTWASLGTHTLTSFRDSLFVNFNELYNYGVYTKKIKVIIQNEDNQALENIQCKAYSPIVEIYSALKPNTEYWLMTGYKDCPAPNYDLTNFRVKIYKVTKEATALNHEPAAASPFFKRVLNDEPMIKSKVWMWLALLAGAVLMILFALSMLKKLKKEQ